MTLITPLTNSVIMMPPPVKHLCAFFMEYAGHARDET